MQSPIRSEREYLSREDIARRVEEMLKVVLGADYDIGRPAPLEKILEIFLVQGWIEFSDREDLGECSGGKILGEFNASPNRIRIDPSLEVWSPRYRFTLAHEIGHLALHRKLIGPGKFIDRESLPADTLEKLKYKEAASRSDLGWVEWQANEFAMAMILPFGSTLTLVFALQQKLGIQKNLGTLYLDDQPANKSICNSVVRGISKEFQVNEKLVWRRLRFLGFLKDRRKNKVKAAYEGLDPLFHLQD